MNSFSFIFWLASAGVLGTLARYGVNLASVSVFGTSYPYSTFFVNVLDSFFFGLVLGFPRFSPVCQTLLLTGFLGGFTTFTFENSQLLQQHRYCSFLAHLLGQNILGIVVVLIGFALTVRFSTP